MKYYGLNIYWEEPGADLKGNFGELKFSDKHGEGLDQGEADVIKELGLLLLLLVHLDIGMEEDEEAEAKGNDEEGVPEEEGEEGGEDAEEHGGVDVAPGVQSQNQNQPRRQMWNLKIFIWEPIWAPVPCGMSSKHAEQFHPGDEQHLGQVWVDFIGAKQKNVILPIPF